MHRLLLGCALLAIACANPAAADTSPRIWSYQYVFATSTGFAQFEPLALHIEKEPPLRQEALLDYLAEALVSPVNRLDRDTSLMLAKALKRTGGPRYRDTFAKAQAITPFKEVRALARGEVREHRETAIRQYVPGSIDFGKLRAGFIAAALATVPDDATARRLATFKPDATIERLFELMGKPQAVVSAQATISDEILIKVRVQRLTFHYRGSGRVEFVFQKGIGWRSRHVTVDPEAFEAFMPYRYPAVIPGMISDRDLAYTQLLSGHQAAMRVAAEVSWRREGFDAQFLDAIAQLLLEQHATSGDWHTIDVYAWMCRVLVTYGGPRYAGVLQRVARQTADPKLRKFASLPMKKVKAVNTAPYVEGTVSLAALRAQHPPLYPERTFISGKF